VAGSPEIFPDELFWCAAGGCLKMGPCRDPCAPTPDAISEKSRPMPITSSQRPLWKYMLLRRLKFLAWLVAILVLGLGGCYLFAPQWLMRANFAREAMAAHLQKQTVQAGDTRWAYYEGGEGPTIVLLHGFADSKDVWLEVAKPLSAHFHLIIPDLPGWGDSSRVAGASYDVDAQAARLQQFVQALGLQRFVLVGHSLGGAIAGVYAAEHPGHVAELALVDAFGLKFKQKRVCPRGAGRQGSVPVHHPRRLCPGQRAGLRQPLDLPPLCRRADRAEPARQRLHRAELPGAAPTVAVPRPAEPAGAADHAGAGAVVPRRQDRRHLGTGQPARRADPRQRDQQQHP
jgi:Predicted hydrolases or acyltransferases (alpha/beta hydrolase superfamily)